MYIYQTLVTQRSNFVEQASKPSVATVLMKQLIEELKNQMFHCLEFKGGEFDTPHVSSCKSQTNKNLSYSIELAEEGSSLQWDCKAFDLSSQYGELYTDVEVFEFKAWADLITPKGLISTLEAIARTRK